MGIHIIRMPDIGEGIAEVELVGWHVRSGDVVAEDQALADVMTDKATVQVPSPVHGRVVSLGGAEGDVMAVGSELIRLEVDDQGGEGSEEASLAAPAAPDAGVAQAAMAAPASGAARPLHESVPIGAMTASAQALMHVDGQRPLASPAVRRRARDLGVTLQCVAGTGPAGRITQSDLDAWLEQGRNETQHRTRGARYAARPDEIAIPLVGLRRRIAQKMQESKRRIPHFTYVEEVDVTELEVLRARLNVRFGPERGKLTLLPLVVRAIVLAVREFPQVNARFDDEAGVVTRYGAVHLGVAAQTPNGLMVPVVHHAETLDPWSCATEILRLAQAAREGHATRDELTGSTLTVTSLGPLGGIVSTPVINWPEVAIVGINRIVERPVVQNGQVVARKLMNLSSSFDHRVVDGVDAAEFIQCIRQSLECPALLFVE